MSAITYVHEEDCGPIYDAAWNIISPYFKQDTTTSKEEVLSQFPSAIPKDEHDKQNYVLVYSMLLDMAAKTPYGHPWSARLADLTVGLIQQTKVTYPMADYSVSLVDHGSEPDEGGYVNEQAYHALVFAQVDATHPPWYALKSIIRAFELREKPLEGSLMAASLWILNYGAVIHRACFDAKYDMVEEVPFSSSASLFDPASRSGRTSSLKSTFQTIRSAFGYTPLGDDRKDSQGRKLTPLRWNFWKQGFVDMAAARDRFADVSSETKTLAVRAARKMDELSSASSPESASITSSMLETKP